MWHRIGPAFGVWAVRASVSDVVCLAPQRHAVRWDVYVVVPRICVASAMECSIASHSFSPITCRRLLVLSFRHTTVVVVHCGRCGARQTCIPASSSVPIVVCDYGTHWGHECSRFSLHTLPSALSCMTVSCLLWQHDTKWCLEPFYKWKGGQGQEANVTQMQWALRPTSGTLAPPLPMCECGVTPQVCVCQLPGVGAGAGAGFHPGNCLFPLVP